MSSSLTVGSVVTDVPALAGRWSVWSPADEGPGACFVVPADQDATATGVKYAVVRGTHLQRFGLVVDLIRTDPPWPDLEKAAEQISKQRRDQRSTTR